MNSTLPMSPLAASTDTGMFVFWSYDSLLQEKASVVAGMAYSDTQYSSGIYHAGRAAAWSLTLDW
jgi:hypothetical protein